MHLQLTIILMLLVISQTSSAYNVRQEEHNLNDAIDNAAQQNLEPKIRQKRNIFWDFFQKIAETKNLIVDQFTDTKNSLNHVYNLLNDDFSDPAPDKPTIRPPITTQKTKINFGDTTDDDETTTTTEAYRISRYEFGRILGRNFRGLKRLQDIEFRDALNHTKYNIQEYKDEARKQFSNSKLLELKNQIKKG